MAVWRCRELVRAEGPYSDRLAYEADARGVDRYVGRVCERWGLRVERLPVAWFVHGHRAGMIRNAEMLEELGVAGTVEMVRRAEEAGVLVERIC